MRLDTRIEERWYAPLVRPVLPAVAGALEELRPSDDPWRRPRTGLGGAVVIHVARGFGLRRWRRAGRAAVVALEGYNQRIHLGEPDADERARWLERDLDWARKIWEQVLKHEDQILARVMDRLLGADAGLCDRTLPEAVLFLRAAVAAGVVVGEVPDDVHAALDRHATWLGLSWEANRGSLDEEGWQGALRAVGLHEPLPAGADTFALERAQQALEGLPDRPVVPLFKDALAQAPREGLDAARNPRRWEPMRAPAAPSTPRRSSGLNGTFGAFSERWAADVEHTLAQLTSSGSESLQRATGYLLGQGGKRVRPMVTLAAAQACGEDPRRALPLAAAVEWLHQGSLVLDDIIDEAGVRRGAAPLHAATSEPFAAGVAVFVFAQVLRALHGMHPLIRQHLVDAATALAMGERLELERTRDETLSVTDYYKIIEAKTARLFGCAAALGALAGEAPRSKVRALSRYGREVGLAFQVIDDLLDYVGDEGTVGKRPGTDLRAAKMTLPLMLLRDRSDAAGRRRVAAALGDEAQLGWVLEQLRAHEIPSLCRQRARTHVQRAREALEALPDAEGRQILVALADELVTRRC